MNGGVWGKGKQCLQRSFPRRERHRTFGKLKGGQVAESVSEGEWPEVGEVGRGCVCRLRTVILSSENGKPLERFRR